MYKSEQNESDDTLFINGGFVHIENLIDWSAVEVGDILVNQEETMDAISKFGQQANEFVPYTPVGPPDRKNFAGDLKFEVEICGAHTNRSKYVYSHRLNRIYVDMGYSFSVQFKWDAAAQPPQPMYVRATTVFLDQSQAEKRVTRCIQHYHETAKNGAEITEAMRQCVLLSTRDAGTQDVYYCGGDSPDQWLSVLVRFGAPTTHAYQFACKNSCSSGINRRAIAVIFTLEDFTGKVWGRQCVGARVCSCPKRDMAREEAEAPRGKRPLPPAAAPAAPPAAPRAKRLRRDADDAPDDDELVHFPPMAIMGRRVMASGLRVMLDMLEEKRAGVARARRPTAPLDDVIARLRAHCDTLRDAPAEPRAEPCT